MAKGVKIKMFKRLIVGLIAVVFTVSAVAAPEKISKANPYVMIEKVADSTFTRFSIEQAAIKENPNLLKDIVREELMPYIDYKYAAFKVIGRNLKKTTDEQRKAFVPVFRDYLVTSYAQVFTLYNNQEVKFEPQKSTKGKKIVSIRTVIISPDRDPIDISFKVRLDKRSKQWKAYDMVAEGVSLLDSKQAELNSLIRQKGLDHVTEMLKEKSARNISFNKLSS